MQIKKIILEANNLRLIENFYSGIMNFMITEKSENAIEFKVGSSLLQFNLKDVPSVYHFAFRISFNQLDHAVNWISKRVPIVQFHKSDVMDFPNWNAKSVYFLDFSGNVLEFIARENDVAFDSAFTSESILSICEIALVTDDVPGLAENLINQFGIQYYKMQPPRYDFTVLGDDDGLLILVGSTRNWFPTDLPAQHFPVLANLEADGKGLEINWP